LTRGTDDAGATLLSAEAVRAAVAGGRELEFQHFWGHRPRKDGKIGSTCLSQWWLCDFEVDGQRYASAEQYMMAEKARLFDDSATLQEILAASDPGKAKALGRRVRSFDDAAWHAARFDIVVRGNAAKFLQNDPLRYFLLGTRDKVLVEASPSDRVWGIGLAADDANANRPSAWRGLNLLGFALMKVRGDLR
jgi:ribA/ribD-fused uncharacterized protein